MHAYTICECILKTVIEVITSQCHKGERSSRIESDHPHITFDVVTYYPLL